MRNYTVKFRYGPEDDHTRRLLFLNSDHRSSWINGFRKAVELTVPYHRVLSECWESPEEDANYETEHTKELGRRICDES